MKPLRRALVIALLAFFAILGSGCGNHVTAGQLKNVGLILPSTINEKVWGSKGYKGILNIGSNFDVEVYYKENITKPEDVKKVIKEFKKKDVNLVFGHSHLYADIFMKLKDQYPRIHFVTFNGEVQGENITSLHFKGKAMGFFGGMVAAKMSKNDSVGVIAAFPWQPEVDGFIEGAIYQNRDVDIHYRYVQDWNDSEKALSILDDMIDKGVDVFYPAGDGYNIPVIQAIKKHGLYAVGYVSDQANLGKKTVLTSTVQEVDKLYELVAGKFNEGKLKSGNLYFDFEDGVIEMGTFSPLVPDSYVEKIKEQIAQYIETGKLPYQR
ncbi:MAG TPA: BMP family ABC transporter substrate-binding protein [Bacillales bacterium]